MWSAALKQRLFTALIGVAVALSASNPAIAASASKEVTRPSALQEMVASGDIVASWTDYALSSLKTNFTWARDPGEPVVEAPTVFTRTRSSWARTPVSRFPGTSVDDAKPFSVAIQSTHISESAIYAAATDAGSLLPNQAPGLRRTLIAPSFTHAVEGYGFVRVSLILAYQKFDLFAPLQGADSAFGVNGWAWNDNPSAQRHKENSAGFGSRLDIGGKLASNLQWHAGLQSRVTMGNFYSYRGVFGQPGSFDIPASTSFGLDWAPVRNVSLSADAEHILYSQVRPFTDYSLPTQYLGLIQSSGRAMQWANLDVYSLAAAWRNNVLGEFALRYSTREQPLPSMLALQQLLNQHGLASNDWEFDYARPIGEESLFRFRAVYAPLQLLGLPNFTQEGNFGANRMRYEALFTTRF